MPLAAIQTLVSRGESTTGRAHGACMGSAKREEEAMSRHIVDDEQRSDRRASPMRPSGSGVAGGRTEAFQPRLKYAVSTCN
jgi:hypothetical protein